MTDRELLELAAKAAGITLEWDGNPDDWMPMYYEGKTYHQWNPLEDDGDALRLAVKLGIVVEYRREVPACFAYHYALNLEVVQRNDKIDGYAATRRAIVRAVAEIARAMK